MALIHQFVIRRHAVPRLEGGLSPMQKAALESDHLVNVLSAPTGAGKSYIFRRAVSNGCRVLFICPTQALAENQAAAMRADLMSDSVGKAEGFVPWSAKKAFSKVQIWNSNNSEKFKEKGFERVSHYYSRNISGLNIHDDGGEIIYITPETLNNIIMNLGFDGAAADGGIEAIVKSFDFVVYDEFHTIESRELGIITTIALYAKVRAEEISEKRRVKVFLLSATPIDVLPTLIMMGLEVGEGKDVLVVNEVMCSSVVDARVLHGDVQVEFWDEDINELVKTVAYQENINSKNKLVVIYDSLRECETHRDMYKKIFSENKILFRNALRDQIQSESSGKDTALESRDVVVGTSSIEMGVTIPHANILITEPARSSLSLLQRIGRISRGDVDGRVLVSIKNIEGKEWLSRLLESLRPYDAINITDLCDIFAENAQISYKFGRVGEEEKIPVEEFRSFRGMGHRTAATCALYINLLLLKMVRSKSKLKVRLYEASRKNKYCNLIHNLLKSIDPQMVRSGRPTKPWSISFFQAACNVRDFPPTMKVIFDNGVAITYRSYWLSRNTSILDNPILFDARGEPYVEASIGQLAIKNEPSFEKDKRYLVLPTGETIPIDANNIEQKYLSRLVARNPMDKVVVDSVKKIIGITGVLPFGKDDYEFGGSMSAII